MPFCVVACPWLLVKPDQWSWPAQSYLGGRNTCSVQLPYFLDWKPGLVFLICSFQRWLINEIKLIEFKYWLMDFISIQITPAFIWDWATVPTLQCFVSSKLYGGWEGPPFHFHVSPFQFLHFQTCISFCHCKLTIPFPNYFLNPVYSGAMSTNGCRGLMLARYGVGWDDYLHSFGLQLRLLIALCAWPTRDWRCLDREGSDLFRALVWSSPSLPVAIGFPISSLAFLFYDLAFNSTVVFIGRISNLASWRFLSCQHMHMSCFCQLKLHEMKKWNGGGGSIKMEMDDPSFFELISNSHFPFLFQTSTFYLECNQFNWNIRIASLWRVLFTLNLL